ncbi:MAG: hypothetical protein H6714_10060 [Myxococcales bacterium]|nr:hypothetical protein [Myxococcales bacterium]
MQAFVEIILKDDSSELVPIRKSRVTVGSSSSADIPILWAQSLQPEHFTLVPAEEGCWVTAQSGAELLANGVPIKHGAVPWGTTLQVPGLRLRLLDETLVQPASRHGGAWLWLLLLLAVPLIVWLFQDSPGEEMKAAPPVAIDAIFTADVTCGQGGPARFRAERQMTAAGAKEERYPFDPADGVQAVVLYRQASKCYEAIGEAKFSEYARVQAQRLERRIRVDLQIHQTRLERSLKEKAYPQALGEARFLRRLLANDTSRYGAWLDLVERRLNVLVKDAKPS